jgi:TetR/AcrR family transcriptional regulator, cholesterol catabolism regulator
MVSRVQAGRQPSSRRLELEQAATRLFAERGYHATSMEDLARAMGLRRGSLYTHITAKEELLLATIERGAEAFAAAFPDVDAVGDGMTGEEALRAALRAHLGVVAAEPDAAACFLWEWRHLGEPDRARAIELRDAYQLRVRTLFARGIERGAFRRDLDAGFATLAFLSIGNWASTWLHAEGPLPPDAVADRFADVLGAGVLSR